jgi:hypothetical protein
MGRPRRPLADPKDDPPSIKEFADEIRRQWGGDDEIVARFERSLARSLRTEGRTVTPTALRSRALSEAHKLDLKLRHRFMVLHRKLDEGPGPGEAKDAFVRRLLRELHDVVRGTAGLVPPRLTGRPRTARRAPPAKAGRPVEYDVDVVLGWVEQRIVSAAGRGQRLTYLEAFREIFADAMKVADPLRYRRLQGLVRVYQDDGMSPARALAKAARDPVINDTTPSFDSWTRLLQRARKARHRRE